MNLLLLPHAGGSAKGYCTMKRYFPEGISLVPLDPAGKGLRAKDAPFEDIPSCAADILEQSMAYIKDGNYAVFGHSMGTILAVELIKQIKAKGLPEPKHVFLSGRCAPDEENAFPVSDSDGDDKIISFFTEQGLIPDMVVKKKPLMDMFTQLLCRDIRMLGKYTLTPAELKMTCDITVMYGKEDNFLHGFDMSRWGAFTEGSCNVVSFEGGHFYYSTQQESFCRCITGVLTPYLTENGG